MRKSKRPPSNTVAADCEQFHPRPSPWQLRRHRRRCLPKRSRRSDHSRHRKQSGMKAFDVRECCCWGKDRCEWCSVVDLDSVSSRGCGYRACSEDGRVRRTFSRWSSPCRRESRSRSGDRNMSCGRDVAKGTCSEAEVRKVKRSLRLLGLELSDFGIYSSGEARSSGWKTRGQCPTFRTKVCSRSVSLEWLRKSVRRAWAEDGLDESHRRLMARAAYEEWYFRKEGELREKRDRERLRKAKAGKRLREELEKKKAKSEEEFEKWLQRKKAKRKESKESEGKGKERTLRALMKSREEIEEAFLKWKKGKDREMEKRRKEKKKEEERNKGLERQKAEKKATAEKAFLQWKSKLEENERAEEQMRRKRERRQEELRRKKKGEESAISFQVWKEAKDHEIKDKMRQMREAERAARETRLAQLEERMYEAEQAFEDWLEKIDTRKQKQFCSISACQKPIPWIPA